MTIANNDDAQLSREEARRVIKAIEDVEREEAAEQDVRKAENSEK